MRGLASRQQHDAERMYRYRVDVDVPHQGFGTRITDVIRWCEEHRGQGNWESHTHQTAGQRRMRYYFEDRDVAYAFATYTADLNSAFSERR